MCSELIIHRMVLDCAIIADLYFYNNIFISLIHLNELNCYITIHGNNYSQSRYFK